MNRLPSARSAKTSVGPNGYPGGLSDGPELLQSSLFPPRITPGRVPAGLLGFWLCLIA